jgi:hypothetical protein
MQVNAQCHEERSKTRHLQNATGQAGSEGSERIGSLGKPPKKTISPGLSGQDEQITQGPTKPESDFFVERETVARENGGGSSGAQAVS